MPDDAAALVPYLPKLTPEKLRPDLRLHFSDRPLAARSRLEIFSTLARLDHWCPFRWI